MGVPPEIDGIFEPEKWIGADSATQFVQMEPLPGEMASEKTICYFGFDKKIFTSHFYVTRQAQLLLKTKVVTH